MVEQIDPQVIRSDVYSSDHLGGTCSHWLLPETCNLQLILHLCMDLPGSFSLLIVIKLLCKNIFEPYQTLSQTYLSNIKTQKDIRGYHILTQPNLRP